MRIGTASIITPSLIGIGLIALLATAAAADKLTLVDGRVYEGTVTVQPDNTVLIVMEYGTLTVPRSKVLQIETKPTPQEELTKKLAAVPANDANALFAVAQWASQAKLTRQSAKICQDVLTINPDHAGARSELGFVQIDGKWQPYEKAIELARSKLEAGQYVTLLESILPAMEKIGTARGDTLPRELTCYALLRTKRFNEARIALAALAETSDGDRAIRSAGLAEILKANPDGMYVLTNSYPPDRRVAGGKGRVVGPGPASLADPLVLEAALRDQARIEMKAGQALMVEAEELAATAQNMSHAKYAQAAKAFERADALMPDISRSYRVEIARRRIAMVRKSCDEEVARFDAILKELDGRTPISPQAYQRRVQEMVRRLDAAAEPLKEIVSLAQPFERELILEVKWAEADIKKIKTIRDALTETLNARG